jgi:acetyl/propionyl-CoA carboxylase alpha subunit/acetyl-CoA carboxylase carboxyltransferase component
MKQSTIHRLLVANRGEIAVRIARTAREMGIETVVLHSEDDANSGHVCHGDIAHPLAGRGASAYLDIVQIVMAAKTHDCDAVHPGYGFLSENSGFARACADAGLRFVGPSAECLDLYGDKVRARALAQACGVPVIAGTFAATSLEEARQFFASLGKGGALMIKAISGGGGRGMRAVECADELEKAYARCQSEAKRAFGNDEVYVERFIRRARHVEVQIIGDGATVAHLWDRECSLQRQNQKIIEIAPAFGLDDALRERLLQAALRMAAKSRYLNLGTFEFLIDLDKPNEFFFIEANPRIQVEHTVTEEVLGLDLVRLQLQVAEGKTLAQIGLAQDEVPTPRGYAVQLRINMESMDAHGHSVPSAGTIATFSAPGGPGVRVDTFGYAGYRTVTSFDSLLAKLIVTTSTPDLSAALVRARRAAAEFIIDGVATNLPFLRALLARSDLASELSTRFIEQNIVELLSTLPPTQTVNASDALDEGGLLMLKVPLTGIVSEINVSAGDRVKRGAQLAILEAMKMEHVLTAPQAGIVRRIEAAAGAQVQSQQTIVLIEAIEDDADHAAETIDVDLDHVRADLRIVLDAIDVTLDRYRPQAVAKRHARNQRTARENIDDLCDAGSFVEYGQLLVANRHLRASVDELRKTTPADGIVAGLATVNAGQFGADAASVVVASYDYMVLAGTQGHHGHEKTDRVFDVALRFRRPLVLFAEGGGGRAGDDPGMKFAWLVSPTFISFARLSGQVPLVGIVSGPCFAGNAALLACTDVIIATEDSNIGMAGPALIEGAGLGAFTPEQIGPIDVQSRNGVVDIRVADEAAAVKIAKTYLSYFQGSTRDWTAADQRLLRHAIPENRLRAYDVRAAAKLIADEGSYLELRSEFGLSYVTALIRIEGRPMGLIANNCQHSAGAIESDGADKASRFLRMCDAHGLPVLSLIDTPGINVGPEAEKTALVRHSARLFITGARVKTPIFALVLRKAYGLGAMAAAGGSFHVPFMTAAWPSGEFGGMGIEGAVKLGKRAKLESIADPVERKAYFDAKVAEVYARGRAASAAAYYEIDAVIDPADTRSWISRGMNAATSKIARRDDGFIDTW